MAMHPGQFLIERVLVPSGVSVRRAADQLGISSESLSDFVAGRDSLDVALAHALAREFSYSREWWLQMQRAWDAEQQLAA